MESENILVESITAIPEVQETTPPKNVPEIIITAPVSNGKVKTYPILPKFVETIGRRDFTSGAKNPTPPGAPKKSGIKRSNACGPDELLKQFTQNKRAYNGANKEKSSKSSKKSKKDKDNKLQIPKLVNKFSFEPRVNWEAKREPIIIPPYPTIQEGSMFPQMPINENFTIKSARILTRRDGLCMIYYHNVPIDVDQVEKIMNNAARGNNEAMKKLAEADAILGLKNLTALKKE